MSEQPNRPVATPRVDIDQTEASTLERRRALRSAEREFEGHWATTGGSEFLVRVVDKVEEYPDFYVTFEVTEAESHPGLSAFLFGPLWPRWWKAMRILFKGRKTRVWQERIVVDELGDAETHIVKGDPNGQFSYEPPASSTPPAAPNS